MLAAGPFIDEDDKMCGTLIFGSFSSRAEAQDFVANDPYQQAGLFEKTEIRGWSHLLGTLPPENK